CSFPSRPPPPPISTLFPYTTLFRSRPYSQFLWRGSQDEAHRAPARRPVRRTTQRDRPDAVPKPATRALAGFGTASGRSRCVVRRSEEHTSELQSRSDLVCRLLLEKK